MRRRKATVELFEEIRREYEFGVGSIQGVARKFGVHRRLVREALQGAVPRERPARSRPRPRLGPVAPFIEATRDILYSGVAPSGATLAYVSVAGLGALGLGVLLFRRLERDLAVVL